jgi:hypothetical protein
MAQPPTVEELVAVLEEHQRAFGRYGPTNDDIQDGARGLCRISVRSPATENVLIHAEGGNSMMATFREGRLIPAIRTLQYEESGTPVALTLRRLKGASKEGEKDTPHLTVDVDVVTFALVLQARIGYTPTTMSPLHSSTPTRPPAAAYESEVDRNRVLEGLNEGILTAEAHLLEEARKAFTYFLLPGVQLEDYLLRCQLAYSSDHSRMLAERRRLLRLVGEDGSEYATHLFAALRFTVIATAQGWLVDLCEQQELRAFLSLVGVDEPDDASVDDDAHTDSDDEGGEHVEEEGEDDEEGEPEGEDDEDEGGEEVLKVDRKAHSLLDQLLRQIAETRSRLRRMRAY